MAGRNPNLGSSAAMPTTREADGWWKNPADWWTGMALGNHALVALPQPNLQSCTRENVQAYFDNGWTLTETLFSGLRSEEAFYKPPYHSLRHPLVFYYAHPAVLYVNKLRVAGLLQNGINPYFEELFETGVDEMSWDDLSKNEMEWPTVREVREYRRSAYEQICAIIAGHPDLADGHGPITQKHSLWALFLSFEHERIHLETSSVLVRELPLDFVSKPTAWPEIHPRNNERGEPSPNSWQRVEAGEVRIGKPEDFPTFGWDNEYGRRIVSVPAFEATRLLISNREFLEFVADGGYREREYWTDEGWSWRSFRNVKWPTFWSQDGPAGLHRYRLRTIFESIEMPETWPALVNYHEAKAYSRWLQKKDGESREYRLITEAEHHALRRHEGDASLRNSQLRHGSESPVDACADGSFCDVFGNVWQWCEDHFHALPGFRVHPYYEDFSTPCFDGKHQMILGGSFASTGDEASEWARFHFRPHFFQHSGFRIARAVGDADDGAVVRLGDPTRTANPYESDSMLREYLTLHFGEASLQMPFPSGPADATRFPQRCADLVVNWSRTLGFEPKRALDIGCGPGGAVFALGETFEQVHGVDLSETFIHAAQQIKAEGQLAYQVKQHGDDFSPAVARASERSRSHVTFRQADACSLPAELMGFDAVLIANLLCRLPSPRACLARMAGERGIVRPGGLLVITTPFTWMESYTPKDSWLGNSAESLQAVLGSRFRLLESREMPLVIREHARKFQYIVSLGTVWQRIS